MAEQAIISRLALFSASPQFCSEQPDACVSSDSAELGTALLAARNSSRSLRAIVKLHRFAFDGELGETFDELLCTKAKLIRKYVEALDAVQLHEQYLNEFKAVVASNPTVLGSARSEVVCSSVSEIRTHIRNTTRMVNSPPADCEP